MEDQRLLNDLEIDDLAQTAREAWNEYAIETLGPKCPPSFSKNWASTGDWGREGNRRIVKALLKKLGYPEVSSAPAKAS